MSKQSVASMRSRIAGLECEPMLVFKRGVLRHRHLRVTPTETGSRNQNTHAQKKSTALVCPSVHVHLTLIMGLMKLGLGAVLVLMICCGQFVSADVFLHNPRGSNNRLDEQNRCVPYRSVPFRHFFFLGFNHGFNPPSPSPFTLPL